jgi:tetratricopeptide (TPR) repeat protein
LGGGIGGIRPGGGGSGTRWGLPGSGGIAGLQPGGGGLAGLRPGGGDRLGGGLRPGDGDGLRPGLGDRREDRLDRADRNRINTGDVIGSGNTFNRIGDNTFNRNENNINNVLVNRPNFGNQNWGSGNFNRANLGNRNWGAGNLAGRPWGGAYAAAAATGWGAYATAGTAGYPSYYPEAYGNWYNGSWSDWPSYPSAWDSGATATAGWLGAPTEDSYAYSNPFLTAAATAATALAQPVYDYSQQIPVYAEQQPPTTVVVNATQGDTTVGGQQAPVDVPATPGVIAPPAPTATAPDQAPAEDPKVKESVALFDEGRALFKQGDYAGAQAKVERAISILPQDRILHEFRALTLFAQGKYPEAATTLYAVLSAGPGWNWQTLKTFYPDVDTYTRQLRALENHAKNNVRSPDDRFLLAYHYLALGQTDAGIREFENVHRLLPNDQLSAQILAAMKPKPQGDSDAPKAGAG